VKRRAKPNDGGEFMGVMPDGTVIVRFAEYPQAWQMSRSDKALKDIEAKFGLTPADRARLVVAPVDEPDDVSRFSARRADAPYRFGRGTA
jgi:phage terminase small subunit